MDWIGQHLGGAERRRVSILNCGIVASAIRGRFDREEMAPVFQRYRQEACRSIEAFGGRIIGQSDTCMMACWGVPTAGEDHLRLALQAALHITTASGPEMRLGCAVETGLVVSYPAADDPDEVSLVGPVLQSAERLQGIAEPGWVVVSNAIRPLVESAFELEPLEPESATAAACWRVRCARTGATRAAAAGGLVGHVAERQALDEVWLRVVEGQPQCVTVSGEPGIGKSRLLRTLEQKVAAARGLWIEIACLPEITRAPLRAVRQAMHTLLALPRGGLAGYVSTLGERDRKLLEMFIRSADVGPQPQLQASRQDRLFSLVLDWMEAQASRAPLAIVFEDLHWADPATLNFLAVAGKRLARMGAACLALTARRPADLRRFKSAARHTVLAVGRLTSNEVQQLLACSPFGAALPQTARAQIAIRSEGIPLFALELARLWTSAQGGGDNIDLLLEPGPLNTMFSARLDALGELKPLAQAAAVIGRQFNASVLALVLQIDANRLIAGLERLVSCGVLLRRPELSGTDAFQFSHGLLRDAAYASVLRSRRLELHRRAADILATGVSHAARHGPEIVAEHCAAAGDHKGAFTWWHKAGLRAVEISATRAAVDHLKRALAARTQDPDAGTRREEIEVLRLLGLQLAALKGNGAPEVLQTLERCLELSRSLADPAVIFDARCAQHSCHLARGEVSAALELGRQLAANADQGGAEEQRLRAHGMHGLALLLGGRLEEAHRHSRMVLEIYHEAQHAPLRFQHAFDQGALALAHLAWGEAIAGRLDGSNRNAAAALALASRLQHPYTSAQVVCVLAARAQTIGDRQEASTLAFAGKTLGERYEFRYWSAWADIVLGWTQPNREGAGIELIESAIRAYRRTGAEQALPYALLLVAESALACNRPRQALAACGEGWQLAHRTGLMLCASELLRVRAVAEMQLGAAHSRLLKVAAEAEILAANQGAYTFQSRAAEFRSHLDPTELTRSGGFRKSET